jgi:hypothetical protein
MKIFLTILLTAALFATNAAAEPTKKVLIVVSNMVDMGDSEKHDARNNLWEVAPPFHIFVSHGFEVDFVSPDGGEVEFMMDPLGISSYAIKHEGFLEKANSSFTPLIHEKFLRYCPKLRRDIRALVNLGVCLD